MTAASTVELTQTDRNTTMPDTVLAGADPTADSSKPPRNGKPPFRPSAFAEEVMAAVLPLMDRENGASLAEGKTLRDVGEALVPLFGHYTIEDAVYVHQMLRWAYGHWASDGEQDDPRAHAVFNAREALVRFICHGMGNSPACAAARANFAMEKDGDGDDLPDDLYAALHFRISTDISCLREGKFCNGERFKDRLANL